MSEVDLATLADAGAFVSHEHQSHLAEAVRMSDWTVDAARSAFRYTDGDGAEHEVRAHFIGTSSPDDGTWLWGWDNINGFPPAFVKQSERVRALGERYAIPEFTHRTLPLTDDLAQTILRAVKAVTGLTAHFSAPTGNGATRAWLLLDDPALALPRPTVVRAVAVLTSALAGSGPVDHRRALTAWAQQRGVALTDEGADVVGLTLDDGSLQVRFDPSGRIAGLGKRLRATDPPVAAAAPDPVPVQVAEPRHAPVAPPVRPAPTREPPTRRGLLQRLLGH
jgi:hypothetical protein